MLKILLRFVSRNCVWIWRSSVFSLRKFLMLEPLFFILESESAKWFFFHDHVINIIFSLYSQLNVLQRRFNNRILQLIVKKLLLHFWMNVSSYIIFDLIQNKPFKVNYSPFNIKNDDLCFLCSESCSEGKIIVENGQILAEVLVTKRRVKLDAWMIQADQSNSSA